MEAVREPITFAAVARTAHVSTWLVYAEGVREHVATAIKRQAAQPAADQRAGLTPSTASLRVELELARQEIRDLRAERDKLRDELRHQLGDQLEAIAAAELPLSADEVEYRAHAPGRQIGAWTDPTSADIEAAV